MIGDFNCHHSLWGGAGVTHEPKAEHLLLEMGKKSLEVLNERGVPTWQRNERKMTIDLGFASPDIATSILRYSLRPEWTTMENHFPIEIQIAARIKKKGESKRFATKNAPWGAIIEDITESQWLVNDPHTTIKNLIEFIYAALSRHCRRVQPSDWSRPE